MDSLHFISNGEDSYLWIKGTGRFNEHCFGVSLSRRKMDLRGLYRVRYLYKV
jgi:hypothetical protein